MPRLACVVVGVLALAVAPGAPSASLPPHRPLRLLVVSDEVNPHGLGAAELTQPGDLSRALRLPDAGLLLDAAGDAVLELPTNDIAVATSVLGRAPCDPAAYDVLVYFAHRIPDDGPDAQARQDAFTAAVAAFLESGGGVVSFHHGSYATPGKEGILDVIGGRASGAVPWEPLVGQDVIAVAPAHFVASNGLAYDGARAHEDAGRGVARGDYPVFANAPDERYPSFDIDAGAGDVEVLFESDYDGLPRLLGFTHRRPGWRGQVVAWQPGEYEPHACDPQDRTFQVLVNAIVHACDALTAEEPLLRMRRSASGGLVLEWSGGRGLQCASRSGDPRAVNEPLGGTEAGTLRDDAPPPGLACYVVRAR